VEVAMREKGVGWILKQLAGDRTTQSRTDAMDVDETTRPDAIPKPFIPAQTSLQPKRTVDLESMAFAQRLPCRLLSCGVGCPANLESQDSEATKRRSNNGRRPLL
jgi:hypothetical protein